MNNATPTELLQQADAAMQRIVDAGLDLRAFLGLAIEKLDKKPARPPLPDLSGHPGYALRVEGGKEAYRPRRKGEWHWSKAFECPRQVSCDSVEPYYILDYTAPLDVPEAERWWDAGWQKWRTVKERYGHLLAELKPEDGYEFTGEFRKAVPGERFRSIGPTRRTFNGPSHGPVLIVRPRPKPRELRLIECEANKSHVRIDPSFTLNIDGVYYRIAEGK